MSQGASACRKYLLSVCTLFPLQKLIPARRDKFLQAQRKPSKTRPFTRLCLCKLVETCQACKHSVAKNAMWFGDNFLPTISKPIRKELNVRWVWRRQDSASLSSKLPALRLEGVRGASWRGFICIPGCKAARDTVEVDLWKLYFPPSNTEIFFLRNFRF